MHDGQSERRMADPFDPGKDECLNCGRTRSEHRMTRGGPVCTNGRRFKPDEEAIRAAAKWWEKAW